jgi:hypothetical protein
LRENSTVGRNKQRALRRMSKALPFGSGLQPESESFDSSYKLEPT